MYGRQIQNSAVVVPVPRSSSVRSVGSDRLASQSSVPYIAPPVLPRSASLGPECLANQGFKPYIVPTIPRSASLGPPDILVASQSSALSRSASYVPPTSSTASLVPTHPPPVPVKRFSSAPNVRTS